tara:strand:+ start:908 stop:1255 length:348 start_codon:yes stop_codon:yes gene_type:complete
MPDPNPKKIQRRFPIVQVMCMQGSKSSEAQVQLSNMLACPSHAELDFLPFKLFYRGTRPGNRGHACVLNMYNEERIFVCRMLDDVRGESVEEFNPVFMFLSVGGELYAVMHDARR